MSAMTTITIVDYGMGNLRSVEKALRCVSPHGTQIITTGDEGLIHQADKVVFPGQGAAGDCMRAIHAHGLAAPLAQAAAEKPFLGICMGLQVLLEHSDENGGTDCLGLFAGRVRHLAEHIGAAPGHKIPHMGWNRVRQVRRHPLWDGIRDDEHFYFVHSYHAEPSDAELVAGQTGYGEEFTCTIASGLVFAVQFHPEKSAGSGLRLLENFVRWNGAL